MIATLFMFPLGMQEATGALMGNSIGANNVALANRIFSFTFKITILVNVLMIVTVILLRD